jgi:hypothetical protein
MGKIKNIEGAVYNNLRVLSLSHISNHNSQWNCECLLCGKETIVSKPNLISGNTKDCGCMRSEKISKSLRTHSMSRTPSWNSWAKMSSRIKAGSKHSPIYGKLDVCKEWDSFEKFYEDMGDRPDGCTIDRIDNAKGYSKENCRWATYKEQCRNKSNNVLISFLGKEMCIAGWSDETGLHRSTIKKRMKKGLLISEVLKVVA